MRLGYEKLNLPIYRKEEDEVETVPDDSNYHRERHTGNCIFNKTELTLPMSHFDKRLMFHMKNTNH